MEYIGVILIAAVVFGLCFAIDQGFTRLFRSQAQHHSGLAVRLSRKYGAFGLVLVALGVAALIFGIGNGWVLPVGGGIVLVMGICLIVYYMTFGIYYDGDTFLLTTFGKKSRAYRYSDIRCQQLYNNAGQILVELVMTDGRSVMLQAAMEGVYPFLDHAFSAWCRQKGMDERNCTFHDPDNSCWFPSPEES